MNKVLKTVTGLLSLADGRGLKVKTALALTVAAMGLLAAAGDEVATCMPKGYRPLDYIRSTGAQYIDTGYAPAADDEVSGRIEVPRVQIPLHIFATVFGLREGNAKNGFVFMTHVATPVGKKASLNRGANVNGLFGFPYNEPVRFVFRANSGWFRTCSSGVTGEAHVDADPAPCGNSLYLFNLNVGAKGGHALPKSGCTWISMKLYSFAIRTFAGADDKSGRLVRDFVPCRDPSGRPGLWDRIGARFYANAGTGEFVGSDEPVEHIADRVSAAGVPRDGKIGRVELKRFALQADIACVHEVYGGKGTTAVSLIPKTPVGVPAIIVGNGVGTTRRRAAEKALSEGRVVVLANLVSPEDTEAYANELLAVASDLRRRFGAAARIVAYGSAARAASEAYAARRDLVADVELIEPTPGTVREELLPKPADRLAKRVQAHALTDVLSLAGAWEMAYRAEPWRSGACPAFAGVTVTNAVPGFWRDRVAAFRAAGMKDAFRINPMHLVLDYPITGHAYDMTCPDPCGTFLYRRKVTLGRAGSAVLAFDCVRNEVGVWINGRFIAFRQGFSTPFELAVPDGVLRKGENEIVLAVSNAPNFGYCDTDVVGMTTRGFFRATGGIDGRCELRFVRHSLADVYVTTAADWKTFTVHVTGGEGGFDWTIADGARIVRSGRATGDFTLATAGLEFWSPESPKRYALTLTTPQGEYRQLFGVRRLVADGEKFRLNGRPVYLRGVTEHCFFPRTIHLPRDLAYYRMATAKRKELGFNFVRFHTFIPPEEYFEAMDELGMLVQVETPNFVTEDEFAAIIAFARRHPSVVIYCTGNETRIDRIAEDYLRHVAEMVHAGTDSLFSPMSAMRGVEGNLIPGKDDIAKTPFRHNPKRLARLARYCDLFNPYQQGLTSYFTVNSPGPERLDAFGAVYCGKPLLAHEICIDGTFIDLSTEKLYPADSPVLKAGMFQGSRRMLSEKGLLARSDLYFRNSNEWMRRQRKFTFEKIRASDRTAGYDFLGDINTQGVLYGYNVGMMDEFYRLKPGETIENVRRYNSAAVLLANFGSDFTVTAGAEKQVAFSVSNYDRDFAEAGLAVSLVQAADGKAVWEQRIVCGAVPNGRLSKLADCAVRVPASSAPVKYLLKATLSAADGTAAANEWEVFGFPNMAAPVPEGVRVTTQISRTDLLAALAKGERVLLFGPGPFRSEGMSFRSTLPGRNSGHVATVVRKGHPALEGMPCEGYCGWEFRQLLEGGRAVQLEGPVPFDPIVEMVTPARFPVRRAALFEYRVGKGRLLVSGFNVKGNAPEQAWLRKRLVAYAASDAFAPQTTLSAQDLARLLDVPRVVGKPNNNLANNPYDPSSVVRAGANAQP